MKGLRVREDTRAIALFDVVFVKEKEREKEKQKEGEKKRKERRKEKRGKGREGPGQFLFFCLPGNAVPSLVWERASIYLGNFSLHMGI